MSKKRTIIVATIFSISVFLGFLAGAYALQYRQTARRLPPPRVFRTQAVSVEPTRAVPVLASNGQQNILLITIDHFLTKIPQVEGIWLVIDLPNNSHLTLLPIYPSVTADGAIINQSLVEHFSLDTKRTPSTDFLNSIASLDLSWDSFIVLDRMGLAELVDQVSNADHAGVEMDGLHIISAIPSPTDDPRAALRSQVALFETICKKMAKVSAPDQANEIVDHLSPHFSSDLSTERIASWLHSLLPRKGSLFCEFPSLPQFKASQNLP